MASRAFATPWEMRLSPPVTSWLGEIVLVIDFLILSSTGRIGVGIHDSRASGGSRTAGEEVQGEEQDQEGGANDQPKPHCPGGELSAQYSLNQNYCENLVFQFQN